MKLLLFFTVLIAACTSQPNQDNTGQQKLNYDTSIIAIIPYDNKEFYMALDSTNSHATLTQKDLEITENILLQSIAEHNSTLKNDDLKSYYLIDSAQWKYRRQYVCYTDKRGEKIKA